MSRSIALVVVAIVALAAIVGGAWYWTQERPDAAGQAAAVQYRCPMHPAVIADRPGACPICGMDLVPAEPAAVVNQWICPMHPQVVQDRPGACPICGMDLVPAGAIGDEERAAQSGADHPEDLVPVRLSPSKLRRSGARSVAIEIAPFIREVRATGRVTVDESRYRQVHAKVSGWIERLYADTVGQRVRAGEPLLEIYSPELLGAQQEFLVALSARSRLAESESAEIAGSGDGLVAAARRRLELLDLAPAEIDRLAAGGEARRTVTLTSPIAGTILERNVAQGARIEPGTEVVRVADLTRVWVLASVYEYELPYVRAGQAAVMTLPYLPGREFEGRVGFVYPTLDPQTRTIQVRLEFANPEQELKPEMFAEVRLMADLGPRLSVPIAAVMDTGKRQVVFADLGDGAFEPRTIEIGLRLADRVEVLSGLVAGESVLAEGNFFIDAESRLKAALEGASSSPAHAH